VAKTRTDYGKSSFAVRSLPRRVGRENRECPANNLDVLIARSSKVLADPSVSPFVLRPLLFKANGASTASGLLCYEQTLRLAVDG
jgi:hypothetical protein